MAKSVGQWVGTVVGAVVGFFIPGGYVMLGAAIGGAIGGAIDPPKGPKIEGPRLSDLSAQTATYGAVKTRAYGTVAVFGNVFWIEGDKLKEVTTTEEQGGKGGGGSETTKYSYYATFAVGLCKGPVLGIRRLWIGDELVYSAVTEADALASGATEQQVMENAIAGMFQHLGDTKGGGASTPEFRWTLYNGSDTQQPNARMQADKGIANVSGYPGESYLVIEDLNLEKWSNTLMRAQVKAEIVVAGDYTDSIQQVGTLFTGDLGDPTWGDSIVLLGTDFDATGMNYVTLQKNNYNGAARYINWGRKELPYSDTADTDDIASVAGGYGYTFRFLAICQSDTRKALTFQVEFSGYTAIKARFYTPGAQKTWPAYVEDARLSLTQGLCVFDRGETFVAGSVAAGYYIVTLGEYGEIPKSTAAKWNVAWLGVSQNYVWALLAGQASGHHVVAKFNRNDLSHVATYDQTANSDNMKIVVLDDTTIYTSGTHSSTGNRVYKWVDGVIVQTFTTGFQTLPTTSDPGLYDFAIASESPLAAVWMPHLTGGITTYKINTTSQGVDDTSASLRAVVTAECALAGLDAASLDLTALTDSAVRGYKLAAVAAARSGFDPLQAAFPFDVYQSGYKVKFVSRGGASVATITEDELGTTSGTDKPAPLLTLDREMDSQLPYRVSVLFINKDREYDNDEQYVERLNVNSVNERRMEMAMVLTPTEAIRIADVLLRKDWIERVTFSGISLPPTRKNLEPTDVVTLQHRSATYDARLTRVEYKPDGSLEASAVATTAAAYTSTAVGAESGVVSPIVVPLAGLSEAILLDIPLLVAGQDTPGMSVALLGKAGGWPGAALFRSDDSGNSYQACASTNRLPAVFTANSALGVGVTQIIDAANRLVVTGYTPGAALYSTSMAGLGAGANLAAIGAHGRWEIISFLTATDNEDGTWALSDFARGLFGTEWAMSLHQANEYMVMLDLNTVGFFGLPLSALNAVRLYRAVTQGASLDSASDSENTYGSMNLKPPMGCYLNGYRHASLHDWIVTWEYVTRTPVEAFSGIANPLSETTASYDVEVWDITYSTLKRTFSGLTGPAFTYTVAQQMADWSNSAASALYLRIYQNSSLIGRGLRWQTSISRPLQANGAYYGAAVLSMGPLVYFKCDEASGNFSDSSGNGYVGTAVATLTYNQTSLLSGTGVGKSVLGSTGRITIPYNSAFLGSHTVVGIFKPSLAADSTIHANGIGYGGPSYDCGIVYRILTSGKIKVDATQNGYGNNSVASSTVFFAANEKAHLAITWADGSGSFLIYKNGVYVETISMYGVIQYNTYQRTWLSTDGGGTPFKGYADELVYFNKVLTPAQIQTLYEAI